MLRDAGVRTKLLAVLAIPTLLLLVVSVLLVGSQLSAARRAGQVHALTDVAIQVNRVVHSLQEERSATLRYLQDSSSGAAAEMKGQRLFTDEQVRTLRKLVAAAPTGDMTDAVQQAIARSAAGHAELASARSSVDDGRFYATETDAFYGRVIRADLDLPGVVASTGTAALAQRLQAYASISSAIEYASHERDLVEVALLRGTLTKADFAQVSALVAQQRQAIEDFQRNAPTATYRTLDESMAKAQVSEVDKVRRRLPDLLEGQEPAYGGSVEWVGAANSRIAPMTNAESGLVADIAAVAEATQNSQEQRSLILVVSSVVGLGLALMLAVNLARRITRPLRRLTVAAGEIGAELPRMVERMQTPGEGPGVAVEPIPVESADEIGRLAEAFNTVNDVTVQVAQEQAALRASIAEMFVNVARRNQVLLGRQLQQLDRMEAREEDPDVLDNLFKLDHLATRMRRNAESLLVLAGIDSTRRLRRPLPLSDVIRTAVSEIEAFDRIDLSLVEDPDVSGRHSLTVAHLLAELLENATHFSNPDTRVVVSASVTGHGVDITVTDYGLGMSDEDVAAANEKIAHPPIAEIAVSQRLGLFVVGRLSARLGATVELRRGRSTGTVAAVTLPAAVFEGLAAPEAPAVEEVPEPATAEPARGTADVLPPVAEEYVEEPADEQDAREPVLEGAAADEPELGDAAADQPELEGAEAEHQVLEQPAPEAGAGARGRRGLFRLGRRRLSVPEGQPADVVEAAAALADFVPVPVTSAAARSAGSATPADGDQVAEVVEPEGEAEVAGVVEPEVEAEVAGVVEPEVAEVVEPEVAEVAVPAEPTPPAVELLAELVLAEPAPEPADPEPEPVAQVEPEPEPADPDPEPVAQADPEPQPVLPIRYAPAVDILPSRHQRGRFGRHRTPEPQVEPAAYQPVAFAGTAPGDTSVGGAEAPHAAPYADLPAVPQQPEQPERPVAVPVAPLPSRSAAPVAAGALPPRPATAAPPTEADLQSSALSELRGLYEPTFAPAAPAAPVPDAGLARRTPGASASAGRPTPPPPPARSRTAAEVRGMLSGFRAGVERGRGSAPAEDDEPSTDTPTR